jgi:hypothetical protein
VIAFHFLAPFNIPDRRRVRGSHAFAKTTPSTPREDMIEEESKENGAKTFPVKSVVERSERDAPGMYKHKE